MICNACKSQRHYRCVASGEDKPGTPPTGLSPEGDAIQRSGLCPCHHRTPDFNEIMSESAIQLVAAVTALPIALGKEPPATHVEQDGTITTLVKFQ